MTAKQFMDWLETARAGDKCVYHVGMIAKDKENSVEVWAIAKHALRAAEDGKIAIIQRKLGDMKYQYWAVKA